MKIRSLVVLAAALTLLAACSDGDPQASPSAAVTTSPGSGATPGTTPDPSTTTSPLPALGSASDKDACKSITTKLSEWSVAFAEAAAGIGNAGSDAAKVKAVVDKTKAANSKFAGELREVASGTRDAQVKDVANNLAASLEKINGQLDAEKIAHDPGMLTTAFDLPEYAAAAEAYERVCAGT